MTNKEKYELFCEKTYVPIYSKSWWLDAVCGECNWDVWLYEKDEDILAAMPYYMEDRDGYKYITKAPLTQNNGIIFKFAQDAKDITKRQFEEKVIDEACEFIEEMGLDVYEQQYQYDFNVWLPFYWHNYTAITRYTYVIDDTEDVESMWNNISYKYRKNIKKGQRNALFSKDLDYKVFYEEHKKIFSKQGLECPFSFELWDKLYHTCKEHNSGEIIYAHTEEGAVASILFLVWDEKAMYPILGGSMPEYQKLESYNALTWEALQFASSKGLKYDFEGSVIKRISKSFREFGGDPKPYFRIRKVFNPDIIRREAEDYIKLLEKEKDSCN